MTQISMPIGITKQEIIKRAKQIRHESLEPIDIINSNSTESRDAIKQYGSEQKFILHFLNKAKNQIEQLIKDFEQN